MDCVIVEIGNISSAKFYMTSNLLVMLLTLYHAKKIRLVQGCKNQAMFGVELM